MALFTFPEQDPQVRDVECLVGCGPAQAVVCGPYLNVMVVSSVDNGRGRR